MTSARAKVVVGLVMGAFAVSCATSGRFGEIKTNVELPQDLPKEIAEKFKIEEEKGEPTPTPIPIATGKGKKRTAKEKAKATVAFEYPKRRVSPDPIWNNEKLVYELTYFGVLAGRFTLQTLPYKTMNQRKVYHVRGEAKTSKVFELFYKVDDSVESFIDYEGIFSHRFHLVLDETKQKRDALELYDSEKKQAYYWNRWEHYQKGFSETKEFFPMQPFSQDVVSALYYLRTVPFGVGKVARFHMITEGKTWEVALYGIRSEMVDSPMGKVRATVVRPETKLNGEIKKTGETFAWVTDDDRKILVRVEAKVKIGVIVAQLKEASLGNKPE